MQDRRRRAGFAHVRGGCREGTGTGRAAVPGQNARNRLPPQCFASHGHFAGDDETRARAFLDVANDESFDAVWFARGGYGSCRVAEAVMGSLTESSRRKTYVGYSDAGMLLAALYRGGFLAVAHGPWPGRPPRWWRRSGCARARLDCRSRAGDAGADGRPWQEDCSIQHDRAEPAAWYAAAT